MTTTFLAGFDGSPASRAAVALTARIAPPGADVIAVNAYPDAAAVFWVGTEAMQSDEIEQGYRERAEATLAELDVEGVERRAVKADSAARGLHDLAVELDASMIGVGTTHRGPFGRLAPGSVGMRLLHGSPCPVLVVPGEVPDAAVRKVGVAYDGREESKLALTAGRELAERLDAELVVVGCRPPSLVTVPMGPGMADMVERDRHAFEQMLARAAGEAGAGYSMVMGPPGHSLAEMSADFDLLVTGSRGYGAVGGVVLGSVSRHLVDHAACPVLVVPRPE